jgi:hypothetical protein
MSQIFVDPETHRLFVQTLNHPLKALLAAAASADSKHRKWDISYKNVIIGSVRIKTDPFHKPKEDEYYS